jgi:hypothetical protein
MSRTTTVERGAAGPGSRTCEGDDVDRRVEALDRRLCEVLARRVALRSGRETGNDDLRIGDDTTRELLAVVEALTRREVARAASSV